jgi:hypothetical protein
MKNRILIRAFIFFTFFNSNAQIQNKDSLLLDTKYLLNFFETTNPDPYSGFGGMVYYNLEKRKLIDKINKVDLNKTQFYDLLYSF